jgi:hypothetical protein
VPIALGYPSIDIWARPRGRRMQQPMVRLMRIPLDFWRHPRATTRRWRSRRRWPSPAEFQGMSWAEFESYLVSSGFDAKISAALAAPEGDRD